MTKEVSLPASPSIFTICDEIGNLTDSDATFMDSDFEDTAAIDKENKINKDLAEKASDKQLMILPHDNLICPNVKTDDSAENKKIMQNFHGSKSAHSSQINEKQVATSAFDEMDRNTMGINKISRQFGIPSRTLRRRYAAKNTTKQTLGKLICNAWIRAATPANAFAGFRGSGIYPVDRNALPDTTFLISDTALDRENPGTSRAPHQVDRTSKTQAQTSYSLDCQPGLVNVSENTVSQAHDLFWSCFEEAADNEAATSRAQPKNSAASELDHYLSTARAARNIDPYKWWGFNRRHYPILSKVSAKYLSTPASSIYSLKQVSKVTSGERGKLVSVCGAINAIGNHLPPFIIFPRKNWQQRMIDGGPPGTVHRMTGPNFQLFLKFFQASNKQLRCTKDSPCLIIFDNHESQITIDSINYCKDNGIHLLNIHNTHTSQKLQPLDRIVLGALKSYYNTACDNWMVSHPGRPLTIYDLAGCLGSAYPNAMTPRNIQKSFSVTGIFPFNPDIFTDDEY
ncbi:unnamed protein product [Colias eurytheme]|nr:unnamed protein product [Colias eurytheme]